MIGDEYIARIADESPSVLLVSMSDKLHHVRALERDYRTAGEALWDRFNPDAGREGTLGYYRGLVIAFARRVEQAGDSRITVLADTLARAVGALEELVGTKAATPGDSI